MNGVQEIPAFRLLLCRAGIQQQAPLRHSPGDDEAALSILGQIAAGQAPINLSETQEYVEWTNPDARAGVTEELHSGRFSVQAMLDLHGSTAACVDEEIDGFIADAFTRGWKCVKIIHGRGLRSVNGPVLKSAVIRRCSANIAVR
ncbi:MAG: Smr/MutS family protein [Nitrospirota bacterium]|nr:Smr/MutS family protein [Nitrospirota bacterium]